MTEPPLFQAPDAPPAPPVLQDTETSEEAPWGYMTDAEGVRRPRKRPGRRPKMATPPAGPTPALEDLPPLEGAHSATEDVAPGTPPKGRRKAPRPVEPLPPFRAGVIAKGVNVFYRRVGRLARLMHYDIGTAIIATTRAAEEDDGDVLTVGEAWENVAKTNPRIRAFWLKLIAGGAMTDLFTSHIPILMALALLDGVRRRLPLEGLAGALLVDDDETQEPSGLSEMLGGINPQDAAQMMQMMNGLMAGVAANVPRAPSAPYRGPSDVQPPYEAVPDTGGE